MPVDTMTYGDSGFSQTAPTTLTYTINQKSIAPLNNPGAVSTTVSQPFTANVNVIAGGTQPVFILGVEPGIWAGGTRPTCGPGAPRHRCLDQHHPDAL